MPFNHLLAHALIPGVTKASDSGKEAILSPESGEAVLVFRLDEDITREHLGIANLKCCDYLFLFKDSNRTLCIFIEFKGSDLSRADEQILSAYQAICRKSEALKKLWNGRARAIIVSSLTAPPKEFDKFQKQLRAEGIELHFGTSRGKPSDIRKILNHDFKPHSPSKR